MKSVNVQADVHENTTYTPKAHTCASTCTRTDTHTYTHAGVGGGALADKLSLSGKRGFVTVGASLLAAPFIWASVMADNPTESFVALGVGFALSESWRAPAAVMAR